jgi:hypothetical protein
VPRWSDPAGSIVRLAVSIDSLFFPLQPGASYLFVAVTDDGDECTQVEVLAGRREVMGILATVVRDTVTLGGELVVDTFDWYAQDASGNVRHLVEDVSNYENGVFSVKAGSWEAGVERALPEIIMYADLSSHLGATYRQETYAGHAEDIADLLAIDASVSVPVASSWELSRHATILPWSRGKRRRSTTHRASVGSRW